MPQRLMRIMKDLKLNRVCELRFSVHYDGSKTDAESLASAFDTIMLTALSTPGLLDEYGGVEVGEFFVLDDETDES